MLFSLFDVAKLKRFVEKNAFLQKKEVKIAAIRIFIPNFTAKQVFRLSPDISCLGWLIVLIVHVRTFLLKNYIKINKSVLFFSSDEKTD